MGRKVTRVEKNRTAPKKSWEFKGGKGWGYKDANATNKKTFVATLSMPYSISKHNTFAKKTLLESSRDKKGYKGINSPLF